MSVPGMNGSINRGPSPSSGSPSQHQGGASRPSYGQNFQGRPQVAPPYSPPVSIYANGTHMGAPGRTGVNSVPGGGPSGATQARQDAAAAAAYAKQLASWNRNIADTGGMPGLPGVPNAPIDSTGHFSGGGSFGGGLNNSGVNLPNINSPSLTGGGSGGGPGIAGGGQGGPTLNFPKIPKAPALDTYLKSDASYQNQLRTFAQALAEFQAGQTRQTASDNTSWQGATRQLGDQKVKDLAGIMNDFASRGMLKSGLYGQNIADYTKTYQNNLNDLNTGHSNALRDLGIANTNFQKDQAIQSAQARADAAARRASQFGL